MLLSLILITLPGGAWPIIGVSFGVAIGMTIAFYLVAAILQSAHLKAIANEELAALLLSIIIIGFWLSADSFFHGMVSGFAGIAGAPESDAAVQGLPVGHIDIAIIQTETFFNQIKGMYLRLMLLDVFVSFMSTLSFNIGMLPGGIGIFSFHIAPYVPLSMISTSLTKVVDGIGMLALTVWGKELILIFSRDIIPLIFLPMGIIMRAFPFTRATGSSIIAIAFALYFIFPLAVMMSYSMIFEVYQLRMDYHYTTHASAFKTDMAKSDIYDMMDDIKGGDENIRDEFEGTMGESPGKVAQSACCEDEECTFIERIFCAVDKMMESVSDVPYVGRFIGLLWDTFKVMLDYTGSWYKFIFGPGSIFLPSNISMGLYLMLTNAVSKIAELFVIITLSTIVEIMVTVTMYRNIALLIGGEPELAGITKIV